MIVHPFFPFKTFLVLYETEIIEKLGTVYCFSSFADWYNLYQSTVRGRSQPDTIRVNYGKSRRSGFGAAQPVEGSGCVLQTVLHLRHPLSMAMWYDMGIHTKGVVWY